MYEQTKPLRKSGAQTNWFHNRRVQRNYRHLHNLKTVIYKTAECCSFRKLLLRVDRGRFSNKRGNEWLAKWVFTRHCGSRAVM